MNTEVHTLTLEFHGEGSKSRLLAVEQGLRDVPELELQLVQTTEESLVEQRTGQMSTKSSRTLRELHTSRSGSLILS